MLDPRRLLRVLPLAAVAVVASLTLPAAATDAPAPQAPPAPQAAAQAPSAAADEEELPTGMANRFLTMQTPVVNDRGIFEALIMHRFVTPAKDMGGGGLLGLDGGASVGLGVEFVPIQNLGVQLLRSANYADYELALKFTALRPSKRLPIGIGARAGGSWVTASYASEKVLNGFGQLLVCGTLADRVTIGLAPSWIQGSPARRDDDAFNVPVSLRVMLTKSIAVMGELVPKKSRGPDSTYAWSAGVEKSVYHHRFTLWIGNTWVHTVDQIIGSDSHGGDVTDRNLRIGFNVVRQWDLM